jgi:hypothetical protein
MQPDLPLDDVLAGFLNEMSLLAAPPSPARRPEPEAPGALPSSAQPAPAAPAVHSQPSPQVHVPVAATSREPRASPAAAEPSPQQRQALLSSLEAAGRSSRMLIWLWVALIIGVFVLIVGLTVYHRDDVGFVAGAILGGTGAMAALLQQVRGVHTRLVSTQLLLSLLPTLAPAQWRTAVQSLLEEVLNKPPRK